MNSAPCARAAAIAAADIINSATPLETDWLGHHPRLLCIRCPWTTWQARLRQSPWQEWFVSLRKNADALLENELPERLMGLSPSVLDVRHLGEQMTHLALLYRLTGEAVYADRVRHLMQRLADEPDWGDSLIYGHWARGFALALDWLWHDLDGALRQRHVETLEARSRSVFDRWASYRSGDPFGYTWNIASVVLGGLTATAGCLYGERPDIAPLVNLAQEKLRCQSYALGPDGVSPEGTMYGGYYTSYLIVNFVLAEDLFGGDLCATTPWLSRYATALHAQALPRACWQPTDAFFMQGDAHGNVFGLEAVLRMVAAATRDGVAQWMADQLQQTGQVGISPNTFLFHDPDVTPTPPANQEPFDLLADSGIAVMRSDRGGSEAAAAFKCGPNIGHHAARRFTHPLGGGHMHPNNGELQIHAGGEWILRHPGYVYKDTAYHNTLLVNGRGQYGEQSEWFEDLPYRQRRKYPCMLHAEHQAAFDHCIADLTAAYPEDLGLISLRRHVVYLRPATWILLDLLDGNLPVTVTALFHTAATPRTETGNTFIAQGERAACVIQVQQPRTVSARIEAQELRHSGGRSLGSVPLLRIESAQPANRHFGIIVIQAWPAGQASPELPLIEAMPNRTAIMLRAAEDRQRIRIPLDSPTPSSDDPHAAAYTGFPTP